MQNGDTQITQCEGLQDHEATKTADDEAIEALLGKEKSSTLVIESSELHENGTTNGDVEDMEFANEDERFRADVASRPEMASIETYSPSPVQEIGSAMLRGLGWKDVPRAVERRPALLGIGAKEVPGGVEELGAWGRVAKGKRKTEASYTPVVFKNSSTGELLTEEELEAKKLEKNKGMEKDNWKDRRDRNLAVDKERKRERLAIEDSRAESRMHERSRSRDRRRHGEPRSHRSRSDERSRHSSSRRERSRSSERSRHGSSRRERDRSRDHKRERRDYDDYDRRYRDDGGYNRHRRK